jgi:hypothetical protein
MDVIPQRHVRLRIKSQWVSCVAGFRIDRWVARTWRKFFNFSNFASCRTLNIYKMQNEWRHPNPKSLLESFVLRCCTLEQSINCTTGTDESDHWKFACQYASFSTAYPCMQHTCAQVRRTRARVGRRGEKRRRERGCTFDIKFVVAREYIGEEVACLGRDQKDTLTRLTLLLNHVCCVLTLDLSARLGAGHIGEVTEHNQNFTRSHASFKEASVLFFSLCSVSLVGGARIAISNVQVSHRVPFVPVTARAHKASMERVYARVFRVCLVFFTLLCCWPVWFGVEE